jgi:hypothetical protein
MLYFLVGTDYPSVTDPAGEVDLLVQHGLGLHLMYLVAYVGFGLVLTVLALGLHPRLAAVAPGVARVTTSVALLWAGMLVASGMVFIVGGRSVVQLHGTDPASAVATWQAIEPIALALGGAGGEVLGGTWVLLTSLVALRAQALPRWLCWLGLVVGVAGIGSTVPGLADAGVLFGLLVIVWFAGLGVSLLRRHERGQPAAGSAAPPLVGVRER